MAETYRKNGMRIEAVNVIEDVRSYSVAELKAEKEAILSRLAKIEELLTQCSALKIPENTISENIEVIID